MNSIGRDGTLKWSKPASPPPWFCNMHMDDRFLQCLRDVLAHTWPVVLSLHCVVGSPKSIMSTVVMC